MRQKTLRWLTLVCGCFLVLWATQQNVAATGNNTFGTATVIDGNLQPNNTVTIRFVVNPVADSATQNDFADGFYVMLPPEWFIISISEPPAANSDAVCGTGHTIAKAFCNAPNTVDAFPFAYWGHAEGSVDACGYEIPAGSECGIYDAPQVAGDPLFFDVTATVAANQPTCSDGTALISDNPADSNSVVGVLVSDGFSAESASGIWHNKNHTITFANTCVPTAVSLNQVLIERLPTLALWLAMIGLAGVTIAFIWQQRRHWGSTKVLGLLLLGMGLGALVFVAPTQATPPSQGYNAPSHDLSEDGPYGAGWMDVMIPRDVSTGDSAEFEGRVYYPATDNGIGMPLDASGAPYQGVVFGHGFQTPPSIYSNLFKHLASNGYLVIYNKTQLSFLPSHTGFANDMRDSLTYLETLSADATSPFFETLELDNYGVFGQSMGGGASFLVARDDARVKALAPLQPAETFQDSSIGAIDSIYIPTMIVVGDEDTTVPTASNGQLMYDAHWSASQLIDVAGADHCGFLDLPFPPPAQSLFCGIAQISYEEQREIGQRLLHGFFDFHLKGIERPYWRNVWGPEIVNDPALNPTQLDPRSQLSAAVTAQSGTGGSQAIYQLTLTNNGNILETYDIIPTANRWGVSADKSQATLHPGDTTTITLTVTLPAGPDAKAAREDTILLTVRNAQNTRSYIELTTTLTP